MEAIVTFAILILFAILAAHLGHDSRETLHSHEHDLAQRSMTWLD